MPVKKVTEPNAALLTAIDAAKDANELIRVSLAIRNEISSGVITTKEANALSRRVSSKIKALRP